MNIRRLVAPLTAAILLSQMIQIADVRAQGAFPAPLPGQAVQQNDSAFPPVNGSAPKVSLGTSSAFPSGGAAPIGGVGGFGAPPPQQAGPPGGDACMKEFLPLREDAEKRGKAIKAASERRAPPDEACKLIGNFSQAELRMIKYVDANSQKCGIPPTISQQLKGGHKNTEKMLKTVCNAAQNPQARGPAGPSLSDVLGSSAGLPEATPTKKGGSTFDTLSGNVLTR